MNGTVLRNCHLLSKFSAQWGGLDYHQPWNVIACLQTHVELRMAPSTYCLTFCSTFLEFWQFLLYYLWWRLEILQAAWIIISLLTSIFHWICGTASIFSFKVNRFPFATCLFGTVLGISASSSASSSSATSSSSSYSTVLWQSYTTLITLWHLHNHWHPKLILYSCNSFM